MPKTFNGRELSDAFVRCFGFPNIEEISQNPPPGKTTNQVRQQITSEYERLIDEYKGIVSAGSIFDKDRLVASRFSTNLNIYVEYGIQGFSIAKMETVRGIEFWACFSDTPWYDKILLSERPFRWRSGITALYYPSAIIPLYQQQLINAGIPVNKLHPLRQESLGNQNTLLLSSINMDGDERLRKLFGESVVV